MNIPGRWYLFPLVAVTVLAASVVLLLFTAAQPSLAASHSQPALAAAHTRVTVQVTSSLAVSTAGDAVASGPVIRIRGPQPATVSFLVMDG